MILEEAQEILNAHGFPCGEEDNIYGPKTRMGLQHFQQATTARLFHAGGFDSDVAKALEWLPKLSENFTVNEVRSWETCYIRAELLFALEDLRTIIGRPVPVHSGYRSRTHNAAVGGVPTSIHMDGYAADLFSVALGVTLDEIRDMQLFSGIGVSAKGFVRHVDLRHLTGRHSWTPQQPSIWYYST